jgi:hypothetical protein
MICPNCKNENPTKNNSLPAFTSKKQAFQALHDIISETIMIKNKCEQLVKIC